MDVILGKEIIITSVIEVGGLEAEVLVEEVDETEAWEKGEMTTVHDWGKKNE